MKTRPRYSYVAQDCETNSARRPNNYFGALLRHSQFDFRKKEKKRKQGDATKRKEKKNGMAGWCIVLVPQHFSFSSAGSAATLLVLVHNNLIGEEVKVTAAASSSYQRLQTGEGGLIYEQYTTNELKGYGFWERLVW
eukprot:gene6695-4793_t